jgi:hypothetical protein
MGSDLLEENAFTGPGGPCSDKPKPEEVTHLGLSQATGSREGGEVLLTHNLRQ